MKLLVYVMLALAGTARAQDTTTAPRDTSCSYQRCSLWFDSPWLKRGAQGERLARPRFFRVMPLVRHVSGDSALHYATRFETSERRAMKLMTLGGLSFLAGYAVIALRDRGCRYDSYPFVACRDHDGASVTGLVLMTGGFISYHVGIPYRVRAYRARTRAVWWHNSQFAR